MTPSSETLPLRFTEDIVLVRQHVREKAQRCGMSLTDQTKIVTAASELARNTLIYGLGGTVVIELMNKNGSAGVRLTFEDSGPGIQNLEQALQSGFSTSGGLGLGLPGAKRLSSEFEIWSEPGKGTRVTIVRWN